MAQQQLTEGRAECRVCGKRCEARNAQAWSHDHNKKTGHSVDLRLSYRVDSRGLGAETKGTLL